MKQLHLEASAAAGKNRGASVAAVAPPDVARGRGDGAGNARG